MILSLTKSIQICIIINVRFLGDIMLIDLSEILSTEGQVKDYDVISELKEFSFNGNVYVVDILC